MMLMLLILLLLTSLMIPTLILIFNLMLSKKKKISFEKSSPFECGFDPLCYTRLPFSIQFFLISMIFLIFDTEITLLVPIAFLICKLSVNLIFITLIIILIIIWGLYLEYLETAIEWKS